MHGYVVRPIKASTAFRFSNYKLLMYKYVLIVRTINKQLVCKLVRLHETIFSLLCDPLEQSCEEPAFGVETHCIGAKTNVTIGYMPYYFGTIVPSEVW